MCLGVANGHPYSCQQLQDNSRSHVPFTLLHPMGIRISADSAQMQPTGATAWWGKCNPM